jgi:hypothetical protein
MNVRRTAIPGRNSWTDWSIIWAAVTVVECNLFAENAKDGHPAAGTTVLVSDMMALGPQK